MRGGHSFAIVSFAIVELAVWNVFERLGFGEDVVPFGIHA
jgi:hypothetical protein